MKARKLGKAIKGVVRKLLGREKAPPPPYAHAPGDTVVSDFSEFSGMPVSDVEHRINHFESLCKTEWEALPAADFVERARAYYASSQNYVFDLLGANASREAVTGKLEKFHPGLLAQIREHPGKRFLEFGGGTGVFCEIATTLGKSVTYLDIPGTPMEFARWRFRKYGLPVEVVVSAPGKYAIPGQYDVVFTDAVMEHVPPTEQRDATRAISHAVAAGGMLVFIVDLTGDCEEFPMHAEVDIRALHATIAEAGLRCVHGKNRFCSVWSRP